MATYALEPTQATVHGQFSESLSPCLTVAPGDCIEIRTPDVMWGVEQHGDPGSPRRRVPHAQAPRNNGPALVGPIAIAGAEPGDALVIDVLDLVPADWGWSYVGDSLFNEDLNAALDLTETLLLRWSIDVENGEARSERGHRVELHPMIGAIGCAPAGPDWHSGWHPRRTGGNLDCSLLGAGTTLILPVEVPEALLSVGDGHAAQGDGELGGSGLECPMERISLRCRLQKGAAPGMPRLMTSTHWVTLGMGSHLEEAVHAATREMLDWIESDAGIDRSEALTLLSLTGSVRSTQIVNEVVGSHLLFDPASLPQTG